MRPKNVSVSIKFEIGLLAAAQWYNTGLMNHRIKGSIPSTATEERKWCKIHIRVIKQDFYGQLRFFLVLTLSNEQIE
jgi:hypothetical protein